LWSLGYEDPTSGRGRGGEDDVSERIRDVELSLELRPEELSNK
jgi:hypothetical protein